MKTKTIETNGEDERTSITSLSSSSSSSSSSQCCIAWRNLRYETNQWFHIGNGSKRKVILNRLNGSFDYHSLNGFMGPSGAGKTTLLNCLNGNRVHGLSQESEIFLDKNLHKNDGNGDGGGDKVVSYFVEQHVQQTIVGRMRVGHILRYAYRFKNGNDDEGDMERHIQTTIDELLLDEKILDRKFEQCSGGEQKRIAIAQELMSLRKPTLLFVDEPTTGLDSNAAHLLMRCLKQLATKHRMTVVTSIHVPSDEILNLFDKLYVLSKGGVCIYSGRPDKLRSHLETEIEDLTIPENQPAIEILNRIACNDLSNSNVISLSAGTLSTEYQTVSRLISSLTPQPNGVPHRSAHFSPRHLALQTQRLFQITFVSDYRMILFQLSVALSFLLSMAGLFSSEMSRPSGCYPAVIDYLSGDSSCPNDFQYSSLLKQNLNFLGLGMFFFGLVVMFLGVEQFRPVIQAFRNEHRNQWYSLGVFFTSALLVGLIHVALFTLFFSLFGYFYTNQHYIDNFSLNWTRLGHYTVYLLLFGIYTQSIGQLVGTIFLKHTEISIVFSLLSYSFFNLFCGFLMDLHISKIDAVLVIQDYLGFNTIFTGIVYTFYGLQRCEPIDEYSLVLNRYHIKPDSCDIKANSLTVLINVTLVRLVTLAYMYWRFNTFGKRTVSKVDSIISIDVVECRSQTMIMMELMKRDTNNNLGQISIVQRKKPKKEVEFEKFSRGKILVAWQDLSLFGTSFIFEQTNNGTGECSMEKAILKNLNGHFRFGTLNAVMGTSGSGKTSLLKVLNGRDKTRLSGTSQFYLSKFTRIQTCFITQDVSGHLLPGLTAKQTLVYASRLKNAQLRECAVDTSQIDHQLIALNLLDELDLSDTVDTMVEKCSGGERKRLALALELTALQMPNLICIDEPTSGLDTNSAEVVVSCLRKLTQTHSITIVASIHQPNSQVLQMFDQLYVLAHGGVCIYSGPPTTIYAHLLSVPEIPPFDHRYSLETLIKHSCSPYPDPIVDQLTTVNQVLFTESITADLLEHQTQPVPDGIQQNRRRFSLEDTWILSSRYLAYVRGHLWLEWLAYIAFYLCYGYFMVNFFDNQMASESGCIIVDVAFNTSCTKTEEEIQLENHLTANLQYVFFVFLFFQAIVLIQFTLSFARESVYFYNEHRNGWYSTGSFYLTKSLFDTVPLVPIILCYVYICNIYQPHIPQIYPHLALVLALASFAYQALGHLFSIVGNGNLLRVSFLALAAFLGSGLVSNYFIPVVSLHYILKLLSTLSIDRCLTESLIILQYGFGRCKPQEFQPLLYLFSLQDSDYYRNLRTLALLGLLFNLFAFALLVYRTNPSRTHRSHGHKDLWRQAKTQQTPEEEEEEDIAIIPGLGSPLEFRIQINRF